MTRKTFLKWVKIQGFNLDKEKVFIGEKVDAPNAIGVYKRGQSGPWQFYDNSGTYTQIRGSERDVFDRLREILYTRRAAKQPKLTSLDTMTIQELYDWAKKNKIEQLPILVDDRPFPSIVNTKRTYLKDALSRDVTYLVI